MLTFNRFVKLTTEYNYKFVKERSDILFKFFKFSLFEIYRPDSIIISIIGIPD